MPAQIRIEKSDNVTRHQKDWLGCYGNTWAPVKVMPGTCERCVHGRGWHAEGCVLVAQAREDFLDAAYDLNQRGII